MAPSFTNLELSYPSGNVTVSSLPASAIIAISVSDVPFSYNANTAPSSALFVSLSTFLNVTPTVSDLTMDCVLFVPMADSTLLLNLFSDVTFPLTFTE